jgi:glycosyltransferase involved in cell wall biosynthesis
MNMEKSSARKTLGLSERFSVIYVGAIDRNKRLDVLIDAAARVEPDKFNFIIVGDGNELPALSAYAEQQKITNVVFTGRVQDNLPLYYTASDVLILPGRGGMVISEAMSYELPVIVYRADGTEYDLVLPDQTGLRLNAGTADEIAENLNRLADNPQLGRTLGRAGKQLIESTYNTETMVDAIIGSIASVQVDSISAKHRSSGSI